MSADPENYIQELFVACCWDSLSQKLCFLRGRIFCTIQCCLEFMLLRMVSFIQKGFWRNHLIPALHSAQLQQQESTSVTFPLSDGDSVVIEDGSFSWTSNGPPYLRSINMKVKTGSLVAVVGPVGSGKSSLLSAMLGEMERRRGFISIKVITDRM